MEENEQNQERSQVPKFRNWWKNLSTFKKFAIIVFLFVIIGAALSPSKGSFSEVTKSATSNSTTSAAPKSIWYPSGYNLYSDNVAWQWAANTTFQCSYSSGSCWAVNLVAKDGCPTGIYAEIAILDRQGVQIDYTNATNTNVPPLQKVRLTFDTFNEAANSARLTKVSC